MSDTSKRSDSITVSLTSFADFVFKSGLAKYSAVRLLRKRYEEAYSQSCDYYRRFRETLRLLHSSGQPLTHLDALIEEVRDPSRRINYELLARGYKRFWARCFQESDYSWTPPPTSDWELGDLRVRLNPELAFEDENETVLIKLYLKKDRPSKKQVNVILHLLQIGARRVFDRPAVSLVDVRRGRLYDATVFDNRLTAVVKGEARSFVEIWRSIQQEELTESLSPEALSAF